MAMIDWVDERLDRWATWRSTGGGSSAVGYGACTLGKEYQGGRSREASAPINVWDDECRHTAYAISQLDFFQQEIVEDYYCSGSAAALDRHGISKSRLSQIMSKIHLLLADLFIRERDRKHF